MPTQTQADRSEAAKKAAATRQRNAEREASRDRGYKAAASRISNEAADNLNRARRDLSNAASNVTSAGRSAGKAAYQAGRSVAARVGLLGKD